VTTRSVQIQPKTAPFGRAGEGPDAETGSSFEEEGPERAAESAGVRGVRRARTPRISFRLKKIEGLFDSEGNGETVSIVPSLNEVIEAYIMPEVPDPVGLQPAQRLPKLSALLSDVLPELKDNGNIHSLAEIVICNEIDRHRDLLHRLNQGLPA